MVKNKIKQDLITHVVIFKKTFFLVFIWIPYTDEYLFSSKCRAVVRKHASDILNNLFLF